MEIQHIAIIGAGPAGLSAALQLKRFGITPLLLERSSIGGLLRNAHLVENYPGFPNGISGTELVQLFREQAAIASIEVTNDDVMRLTYRNGLFHIKSRRAEYHSKIVVIASGTKPITFPTDLVRPETLDLIQYEVHPLREVTGKSIVVVGAGDAAFDYALSLAHHNHVIILNRSQKPRCSPLLWERALANPNIAYLCTTSISKVSRTPDGRLLLECKKPEVSLHLEAHYMIGALGREPQLDFVEKDLFHQFDQLEAMGLLHLIGDVKNGHFRQVAIAVGEGILAGMKIYNQLKELIR